MTVKIDFEFQTPHGLFRDALHLADDHTFTDEEIQAMKQQRVDNWIAVVTAPPVEEVIEETFVDEISMEETLPVEGV
jgi:hypothetical protein